MSLSSGERMHLARAAANRRPLARPSRAPHRRPVVAAAAVVPADVAGVVDSKKITREGDRERLYEEILATPGVRYAVAVVSAERIDEINILQATLEGMRMAVEGVVNGGGGGGDAEGEKDDAASAERQGSYVITGGGAGNAADGGGGTFYALVDGNRTPGGMPCPCEALVKGDGREYAIGAASILAKVTRDRLMREYDAKYPAFGLSQVRSAAAGTRRWRRTHAFAPVCSDRRRRRSPPLAAAQGIPNGRPHERGAAIRRQPDPPEDVRATEAHGIRRRGQGRWVGTT